ncbi:bifunctional UDP-N-acetylmuramoyl-tripeptide:D-alanyl-D-alanine ligase/alanine racemase [Arcticibacter sp. MXS-1]|uniref:bifunctional UDP-N-acetylmuramoyl-tripeptide:D-alanyl-D-alanine ligase/alanine racemase n=1 Tax=Arcticibacter sp. MXS-1 TaxID=3341726 RepID=UPI0035A84572
MYHTSYSIKELAEITEAKSVIRKSDVTLYTLAFDSRRLGDISHTLFFAIQGRRDGHDFLGEAYQAGVRNFVISQERDFVRQFPDANFLIVADVLQALQQFAAWHRRRFRIPVIGITGSNGKTIVKEWLYQLLAPENNIVRSPKSYNSQIGVPVSVWSMTAEHTLALFEAGVSRSGEMAALQQIIRPVIGILTNIGQAHNEGFSSMEEKIAEKLKLFSDCELFIYSPKYLAGYTGAIPGRQHFTWGWDEDADLRIIDEEVLDDRKYQFLRARFREQEIQCMIPFTDAASVENAICCWATMLALGYSPSLADQRLEKLHPVSMRLELKTGIHNCSVIDDSYSLDISSLAIALDFLKQQNQHQQKTLILSDVPEAGVDSESLYMQVANLLVNKGVNRLVGIGQEIGKHQDKFAVPGSFFPDTASFLNHLDQFSIADETILLKGARKFEFEKISKALTQKVHETVLEINLNAMENNLNYYKAQLKPGVKITTMVKAFSYGSGSFEIANLLQFNKVDYLAVAFADEGVSLREAGISLPIMVMNPDVAGFETMIENSLEPEIYSLRVLREFCRALKRKSREEYPVHIKLDTGMHRLGFMKEEVEELIPELQKMSSVKVRSAFSHLTSSEEAAADGFTRQQIEDFRELTSKLEAALGYTFIKHIANTSAISRWPEAQFDMVRLGIGLYGVDSVFGSSGSPLEPVARLKTSISQIKQLKKGDAVGYNRKGVMPHNGQVATVKIGYADGYDRKLGNGIGKMLVNGVPVPTIGNICMDMCMLDITGVEAREGDEVIVFNEQLPVQELARLLGTIPYEVLTGISQRVKRVYYYE